MLATISLNCRAKCKTQKSETALLVLQGKQKLHCARRMGVAWWHPGHTIAALCDIQTKNDAAIHRQDTATMLATISLNYRAKCKTQKSETALLVLQDKSCTVLGVWELLGGTLGTRLRLYAIYKRKMTPPYTAKILRPC